MKILFLEPFYGGSHKDFALGLTDASRHEITLVTLPDRFWKWRMRGAALYFAEKAGDISKYDMILVTDMIDLTDFQALLGPDTPPVVFYFHENQLSYPLSPGQKRDFHLGFTNIVSAYSADRVLFNSQFHLDEFILHAGRLIKQMPDFRPKWMIGKIKEKTSVLYPGCRFDSGPLGVGTCDIDPPLVVWNHRWEFDKKPEQFFSALRRIKEREINFSLAVLGERLDLYPEVFDEAKKEFSEQIKVFGYAKSREEYLSWLKKGSVAVSCAIQENFGIAVVEAVRHGCLPLLPRRLSYPEIMPERFHPQVIYDSDDALVARLSEVLQNSGKYTGVRDALSGEMAKFSWEEMIDSYDDLFEEVSGRI